MSREIKFRAWVVRDSEDDAEIVPYMEDMNGVESYNDPFEEHRKGNIVLLQYTGLQDKNGREIYEGDILQDDYGAGEVEWVKEHCAYMVFTRNPSIYHRLESDGKLVQSEVIGSIYENPELLEV
jgi:uncharacterized phage protein (TIGR01671 family)